MIQITAQMRILVAVQPVDFRKGIDGLARVCREELRSDPFTGAVFVFQNKRATAIKLLSYDGQGFWLAQKRLSQGRFQWWPQGDKEGINRLDAYQLQVLLWNGNPTETKAAPVWRRVPAREKRIF